MEPVTSAEIPPASVTQGQQNVAIGIFKLTALQNAAIWKNLKLDRVGDAAVRIAILQASRSGGMSITTRCLSRPPTS